MLCSALAWPTACAITPRSFPAVSSSVSPWLAQLVGDPLILMADEPTGNLDSRNGEAVMELLRDLHRNGATICMVTHDERYSHFAERTVRLFDGRVVEETQETQVNA